MILLAGSASTRHDTSVVRELRAQRVTGPASTGHFAVNVLQILFTVVVIVTERGALTWE